MNTQPQPRHRDRNDGKVLAIGAVTGVIATAVWTWFACGFFNNSLTFWRPILGYALGGAVVITAVCVTGVFAYYSFRRSLSSRNTPIYLIGALCFVTLIPAILANVMVARLQEGPAVAVVNTLRQQQRADRDAYLKAIDALDLEALLENPRAPDRADRIAAARALAVEYQARADRHAAKARSDIAGLRIMRVLKARSLNILEVRSPAVVRYIDYMHGLEAYRLTLIEEAAKPAPNPYLRRYYERNEEAIAGHIQWLGEDGPLFVSSPYAAVARRG